MTKEIRYDDPVVRHGIMWRTRGRGGGRPRGSLVLWANFLFGLGIDWRKGRGTTLEVGLTIAIVAVFGLFGWHICATLRHVWQRWHGSGPRFHVRA
jgi:hypothetical protein